VAGDRDRAIEAFREAADRKPDEWAAHYLLAQVLAKEDVAAAREEMERAAELNPQSAKVSRALDDLRAQDEKDSRPPG
jgi:Flp pilus assembly protein TadD